MSSGSLRFLDRRAHAGHGVLLEEALALDAVRRAHQRQRPVDDELLHARPHQRVVLEQLLLGDMLDRPQLLLGMRERDGRRQRSRLAGALGCLAGAFLPPAWRRPRASPAFPSRSPRPACPRASPGTNPGVYCRLSSRNGTRFPRPARASPRRRPFPSRRRRRMATDCVFSASSFLVRSAMTRPEKPVPTWPTGCSLPSLW